MSTPFATRGTGDLIIRDGDTVSGDSATGGAGGNVTVEGGNATPASATDGGDVILQPGLEDGAGSIGEVSVTNRTGTEDDPIIAFSSASGNSHTIRWRVGTIEPNSDLVPASAGGDLYVRSDGTMWIATTSGTGNWSQVGSGGGTTRIAQSGVITEALQFFVDFNNQSSWTPNQLTTWTDTIAAVAGTASNTSIVDGHLNFNGTTSLVNFGVLPTALVDLFAGGGTLAAWVRPESAGESSIGRIFDTTDGSNSDGYYFRVNSLSGGMIGLRLDMAFSTGSVQWDTTNRDLTIDEWNHVVVVFDSDAANTTPPVFYVNGVLVTSGAATTAGTLDTDSGRQLILGNRSTGVATFDGDIEIAMMYDGIKSAEEVSDIYKTQSPRFFGGWGPDLVISNTSDGTDVVMTDGDTFRGVDATSGSAFDLAIRGGTTTDTAVSVDGGDLLLTGGSTGSTSFVGSANGGHVRITGGGTAGTGLASGGGVFITGATPTSGSGTGGSVTIASGDGATGGGNANAGDVSITTGDGANASASGGSFSVILGASAPGSGAAGSITMTAGANPGTTLGTPGGDVTITSGTSLGRTGNVFIRSGDNLDTAVPGLTNTIGNITIETGTVTGGSEDFTGGSISITSQGDTSGGADSVIGGSVSISAGNTGFSNQNGGDISLTAGDTNGSNQRFGGNISLTAGNQLLGGASSTSEGGSIVMTPGTSAAGTAGRAKIAGTGTLEMIERTTALDFIAGSGYFWVRDDGPNVPMFTDDEGMDWQLAGSGTGLQSAYESDNSIITDAGNGNFDVSGTEAISLDASAASNFTVAGANLVLATTTSGTIDIDGASNVTIDSIFGGIALACTGAGSFTTSTGDLTLSTSNATTAADIFVTAGNSSGAATAGGALTLDAGDGNTAGAGGALTGTAGAGGTTGTGGAVSFTGGDGGLAGGSINLTSGESTDVNNTSGDIRLTAAKGVGIAGAILLTTESDDLTSAPVTIDTQSGFADQGENKRTFGRSEAIALSTSNQAVVALGAISSNGDQMRIEVKLTAVDTLVPTNVISYRFDGDFYRDTGTVTAITPHTDTNVLVGVAAFTDNLSFSIGISGGTLQLELTNDDGSNAYTLKISATFITQLGGASS